MAAAAPISRLAQHPTNSQLDPTSTSLPGPADPDETQASAPSTIPPTNPIARPVAASRRGPWTPARSRPGRNTAAVRNPASTGTSSPANAKSSSPAGSAPSRGTAGRGPRSVPSGETADPAPSAKPGPVNQLAAQITRFGTNASCPTVRVTPPRMPDCTAW